MWSPSAPRTTMSRSSSVRAERSDLGSSIVNFLLNQIEAEERDENDVRYAEGNRLVGLTL
jgi:hypothetical protein